MRYLTIALTTILTSFYFFPFEFSFLPGANTKMIMAGFGLVLLFYNMARGGHGALNRDVFKLSVWAMVVSLIALAAVAYNETPDYTYATYIVSMWVWLGGAYTTTQLIKAVHGKLTIVLVCNYLIGVCTAQCIIAYAADMYPWLKNWIDSFLASEGFMGKTEDRIYGIGASLDVAGMRFATMLMVITYLVLNSKEGLSRVRTLYYLVSFLIIGYVGNMMGRTTTVGMGVSLMYALWVTFTQPDRSPNARMFWKMLTVALVIIVPYAVYKYNTSAAMHERIRFAFEGFFSLAEKGHWETHSNEILKSMYVLPDNAKTWLIGDGYFDNPIGTDPYYTGKIWGGFYHGTDVGYLRFIFYFGIFGLLAFMAYMWKTAQACMRRFAEHRMLFALVLMMNYIVWFKVSSDLFLFFALFLCLPAEEESTQPVQAAQNSN